jgi:hypothetical protein
VGRHLNKWEMKHINAKTYPVGENWLCCEIFMLPGQEILLAETIPQGNAM